MVINAEMERKQKERPGVFQALQKKKKTHTHTELRTHYLPTLNHNNATIRKESKVTQAVLNIKSMPPSKTTLQLIINHI
jgi:septal ring-binding cell division protein DamX